MEPRFEEKASFKIVGLQVTATYKEMHKVPEIWSQLVPHIGEVKFIDTWGVVWSRENDFDYIACFEACHETTVPDGMLTREIPANRYVVFTHRGKLTTLGSTYDYAYNTWFPQSGHERNDAAPYLELYDDRFKGGEFDDSEMEIWLPVR